MSKLSIADATGAVVGSVETDRREVGIRPQPGWLLLRSVARDKTELHLTDRAADSLAEKHGYEVLAVGRKGCRGIEVGDRVVLRPGSPAIGTPNKGQMLIEAELVAGTLFDPEEDEGGEVVYEEGS